jgi:hypothetical protein
MPSFTFLLISKMDLSASFFSLLVIPYILNTYLLLLIIS